MVRAEETLYRIKILKIVQVCNVVIVSANVHVCNKVVKK
jgi:hypothetical protein